MRKDAFLDADEIDVGVFKSFRRVKGNEGNAIALQVVLIVLAGVAGTLCGLAAWRLQGGRGVPVAAIGVAVVAALSLILPIAL